MARQVSANLKNPSWGIDTSDPTPTAIELRVSSLAGLRSGALCATGSGVVPGYSGSLLSTAISSRQANIVKAEVIVTEDRKGINNFTVEVADLDQLQSVMGAIKAVKDVIGVERVRGL